MSKRARTIILSFMFLLLAIIISGLFGVIIGQSATQIHLYPNCAIVVELNYLTDTLTVEDSIGHLWQVKGIEDYMLGDLVGMIMHDMGTELVYDDVIVKMYYCGWVK